MALKLTKGEPSLLYTEQGAIWSDDEPATYRYLLWRTWAPDLPVLLWILLNPSVADQDTSDPTNTRGEIRARKHGFGTNMFANLYAYRSPYPDVLKQVEDPVGPDNDECIREACERADTIICGWGVKDFARRDLEVWPILEASGLPIKCIKMSGTGRPMHPLYLPYSKQPEPFHGP